MKANAAAPSLVQDTRIPGLLQEMMTSEQGVQQPYLYIARLHELGDVFALPDGSYFAVGYPAVLDLVRSGQFRKGGTDYVPPLVSDTEEQRRELASVSAGTSPFIVNLDPPDHTRLRALVQRSFTPRHVAQLESLIPLVANELLDRLDPGEPVDIIGQFSAIFAPEMMSQLIGLPAEQRTEVARLTAIMMRGFDPGASFEVRLAGERAARTQREYIERVIQDKRLHPADDLVSALAASAPAELSESELVALLQVLYLGGYETTAHMVGNGLVALLNNPEQLDLLRRDGTLMRRAVDEMLRFDGAISLTKLLAGEAATLCEIPIPTGATVVGLLAAANHDPAVFEQPDRFDIKRQGPTHLAFAGGRHFCLGNHLARAELEVVFNILLRRYPQMRLLDKQPRRIASFHQRAFERVDVLLQP
jgi:cytochrome P450